MRLSIIYSYNKVGMEADEWDREIRAASDANFTFTPFNHGRFIDPTRLATAWQLDARYRADDPALSGLYVAFERVVGDASADAVIVANCPPYHPDFLRRIPIYKVLCSGDDPDATYRSNIPYLHAYHHVMFYDPVHSRDMDMVEKMRYCGMSNADWLPLGVMDYEFRPEASVDELLQQERDVEIVYVGSFFRQKLHLLKEVRRAFGRRFRLHGLFRLKHNLFFNVAQGPTAWVRPVSFEQRRNLFQRSRIGFNIHWNEYGLGNQRLYQLPANGVFQLSDCADHLHHVYEPGREVEPYRSAGELIEKIRYYLEHNAERERQVRAAHERVVREYRFREVTRRAATLIVEGMQRIGYDAAAPDASLPGAAAWREHGRSAHDRVSRILT